MIAVVLMVLAAICFALRVFKVDLGSVDLVALGLCFMAAAFAVSWAYYGRRNNSNRGVTAA